MDVQELVDVFGKRNAFSDTIINKLNIVLSDFYYSIQNYSM